MNNKTFQVVNRLRTCKEYTFTNEFVKKNNNSFEYYYKNILIAKHIAREKKVFIEKQTEINATIIEKINGVMEIFKIPYKIEQTKQEYYIKDNRTFQTQNYSGNEIQLNY